MPSELLGNDFRIYIDSASSGAGSYSSPTWGTQECSLGDISFDPAFAQVEINKRCATKTYKKGRGDWKLKFTMNFNPSNTNHVKIRNAIFSGSRVHIALAEGDITTEDYYHAWWLVTGSLSASLDNAATWEVECMPHAEQGSGDTEIPALVTS